MVATDMPQQLSSMRRQRPARQHAGLGIADELLAPVELHGAEAAAHGDDLQPQRLAVRDGVGEPLLEEGDALLGIAERRTCSWALLQSHLARGEVLHDLDRAAADRHHLGLAIDALDLGAAQVARAAEHLHRLVGAELHGRGREVLQHADLRHRLLALADPPGQQLERRLHGIDAHRHVDQPVAHHLVGDQRLAEGVALAGIGDRLVEADLGVAAGAGRHAEPLLVEVQHDADEALVLLADQVVDRHPHVVEEELGGVGRPPAHLLELGAAEALAVALDQQQRHARSARPAGAHRHGVVVGAHARGDEHLGASVLMDAAGPLDKLEQSTGKSHKNKAF